MAGQDDASELIARHATDDLPAAGTPEAKAPAAPSAARSAALVTAGIILSRLVGLVRQRIVAHYFGLSLIADVISAAFRVGNITQNLLGEGTLSASFIPVYAKLRAGGKSREATAFALSALGFLILAAGGASLLGALLSPWLTHLLAPGYEGAALELAIRIVRVVFPMTGLLVLCAWGLGVLNAHRRFFLPYAAPVIWSVAQIAGLAVFGGALGLAGEELAMALAFSALAGAGLQLLVLLPAAKALLGGVLRPRFDRDDPALRDAGRRLPGVLLGRGVIQISSLIDTALVSLLGVGAQAAFGYAQTIYLLPMSLLGTGEAAASLPDMAEQTTEEDVARLNAQIRQRLGASLARVTVLTIPTTFALAFLGHEIIRVLLQGGSFDAAATQRVDRLLVAYSFALLGNATGRVLTTTAYAIGDTRTPARYAIYRVIASTVGALVLMRYFDAMGVVLGSVIAAWVETIALGLKLRARLGGLGLDQVPLGKTLALAALSLAPALGLSYLLPDDFARTFVGSSLVLGAFGAAFAVAAPALGLFNVRALLRRRR
jgi:putative peptidoglycan lipid II flippase